MASPPSAPPYNDVDAILRRGEIWSAPDWPAPGRPPSPAAAPAIDDVISVATDDLVCALAAIDSVASAPPSMMSFPSSPLITLRARPPTSVSWLVPEREVVTATAVR